MGHVDGTLFVVHVYLGSKLYNCKCGKRRHVNRRLLLEHHLHEFIVVQLSVSVDVRLLHKLLHLLLCQLLTQHSGYLNLG